MRRSTPWLFYGGLTMILGLTLAAQIRTVLSPGLGGALANNSEGLSMTLVTIAWLEFVRPRLPRTSGPAIALGVGLLFLGAGLWLVLGPLEHPADSRFITLNETAFAIAVLLPYLQVRRPLPPAVAVALPVLCLVVPAIGGSNELTTDLAETFFAVFLVGLAVDFVDGGILTGARAPVVRCVVWLGVMALAVASFHTLVDWRSSSGIVENVWLYAARGNEMFVASALVVLYFSVLRPSLRERQRVAPVQADPTPDRPEGSRVGSTT